MSVTLLFCQGQETMQPSLVIVTDNYLTSVQYGASLMANYLICYCAFALSVHRSARSSSSLEKSLVTTCKNLAYKTLYITYL